MNINLGIMHKSFQRQVQNGCSAWEEREKKKVWGGGRHAKTAKL
jgi:hypothetical protein